MDEVRFGVFIEYSSVAEAERAAEGLKTLLPSQVVAVWVTPATGSGRADNRTNPHQCRVDPGTFIVELGKHCNAVQFYSRYLASGVRKWFRENRNDSRGHYRNFTVEDLLQVPWSFLEQYPKLGNRDTHLVKIFLKEHTWVLAD